MDFNVKYKLVQLTSTKAPEYADAMKIYTQSIDFAQKTSTNEIAYWINHHNKFPLGNLFFLTLLSNDIVIGYAELSYIKSNRTVIIDYIIIDKQYNSNSAFYTFYWLIIDFLYKNDVDFDFITKEIFCKFDDTALCLSEIKMYELENFKVANCLYIQPQLEMNNIESEKESVLMIYQKSIDAHKIKSDTYISIVKTIYSYYQVWDEPFIKTERNSYYNKYDEYLNKINASIDNASHIVMNGYPKKHSYSSDDKSIPSKAKPVQNALVYTSIVIVLVLGILFFAKEYNVELTTIAIVSIAILFIILSFVALSDSKAAQIIKNLPVFSKLFSLLK